MQVGIEILPAVVPNIPAPSVQQQGPVSERMPSVEPSLEVSGLQRRVGSCSLLQQACRSPRRAEHRHTEASPAVH